jgi:hypothetical protein
MQQKTCDKDDGENPARVRIVRSHGRTFYRTDAASRAHSARAEQLHLTKSMHRSVGSHPLVELDLAEGGFVSRDVLLQ